MKNIKLYTIYLIAFILCFTSLSFLTTNADSGTVYYTYHSMVKGQQNYSVTEYKHTTNAVLYTPSGYITCSNTYLQYSEIPTQVCGSPSAYSWVIQYKENVSWQAHYHVSSAYPFKKMY